MRKKGARRAYVDVAHRGVKFNLTVVSPNLQRLRDAALATFSATSSGGVDINGGNVRRIIKGIGNGVQYQHMKHNALTQNSTAPYTIVDNIFRESYRISHVDEDLKTPLVFARISQNLPSLNYHLCEHLEYFFFFAICFIICHYPANVCPRHLMAHQVEPRYGVKTAEMAGGKNVQRQEGRRKSRGMEEEEEEDDNDDEDDEESSCSRIAYRSVSPKATEPLILIIGYNLVAANSCQSDKCTAINSIWKCGAQQTANSQVEKREISSYQSDLTKADLRADIHFTFEPLLVLPLIVSSPLLISRADVILSRRVLPSPFAATIAI
ncbi:hypothetical protein ALC62_07607 [Cyphomyrmex costatus]|uniref:Uncharacterized protein n=1 Tax=Cyphomyrmex costatus TaxID=456900 RepID=A0A195CLQ9_9HYME|nr:hypothetical protein ALC62_07607 [Cyphomyrmex costatus]